MPDLEKREQLQDAHSYSSDHDTSTLHSCNCDTPHSASSTHSTAGVASNSSIADEGGLKASLTVFGSFLALFSTFGQMNAFGTFQSWYSTHQLQHMSPSAISWIGSLQLWVFFFSGGIIGRAFDACGPRGLMACGTILYLLSAVFTSLSTRYYMYVLSQGVLFGFSVGLLFYPSMASVSTRFPKYRATATGIAAAGSSVGGVVYPVVLQWLFRKVGFEWGVRVCGLSSTALCLVATLSVTCLPSPKKSTPIFDVKSIMDAKFAFLAAGSCLVALGLFIPFFYIVDYAKLLSTSPQTSFLILAAMNAGGVFGRVVPAYISDTIGRFNLLAPSAFVSGLSCLVLWLFARNSTLLYIFAVTYGFFSGAFISVVTPCVAQISASHEIGTRIGMLYTIISFPSLLSGPVAGWLLTRDHGSYSGAIIFSGITIIAGSFFIFCAKLAIDRRFYAKV
ncbi:hypothetical protein AX17_003679 [Amanita inopinata Kibby_2008]|nr:hypothetical protein AX17_003679 [Amanita inopinata Kibby_2008]